LELERWRSASPREERIKVRSGAVERRDQNRSCAPHMAAKTRPSSLLSPQGRSDDLSLSLPHGRDGRETPVRAGEWVWARVGARVGARVIELLLVFGIVATATSDETGRRFTLGGTRRGESLRMKLSRIG